MSHLKTFATEHVFSDRCDLSVFFLERTWYTSGVDCLTKLLSTLSKYRSLTSVTKERYMLEVCLGILNIDIRTTIEKKLSVHLA